ncbi:unnamed protein product [Spirodela intermedia]|uniref:Uncharacterized protein n=1 Tax=Spirodela intermedia TaxID=51605 RepID=A0A7I8L2M2_SPIIN|nr:unnamed protein product [Spirodela intermedia]
MKVHPMPPKKRNIAFRYGVGQSLAAAAMVGRQKKLRRLPHIFSKVLELPFAADAEVAITEDVESFHFIVATAEGSIGSSVRAHAVEIHPGVTKVVIRENTGEDFGDGGGELELLLDDLEMDRWRFRLPPCTRPELASAAYAGGELTVTVPKGSGGLLEDHEDDDDGGNLAGEGIGRLIVVQ